MEDAEVAIENALRVLPNDPKVRLLGAEIALAELEYDRTIQLSSGLPSTNASAIRARAYWYSGKLEQAADELERLISDPDVRDPWARDVAKLAQRGAGRRPFQMSGGAVAVAEMPEVSSTALVVALEVNGEPALGRIETSRTETVIGSGRDAEPSWISLRFGDRIEVKDVPALAEDLSGESRELRGAPIKVLIGANLLRHLHPTFDFLGGQFVVRRYEPPPPPEAATVPISYVRGDHMLLHGAFGAEESAPSAALLVDTGLRQPLALAESGWKKAGMSAASGTDGSQSVLPVLRLGALELPRVSSTRDSRAARFDDELGMEVDGLVGSGLLAWFRVTLFDQGRRMWLEEAPPEAVAGRTRRQPPAESKSNGGPEREPEPSEQRGTPASKATPPSRPSSGGPSSP